MVINSYLKTNDFQKSLIEDFHRLMIEALRQRERDIIQFIAILAGSLAGFGWLISKEVPAELTTGSFVIGTAGVLFLLLVGSIYSVALGYNYRYITLQLAKIEVLTCVSKYMLITWPRKPQTFVDNYGCYCKPPEIIQVFWISFLIAIASITLAASLIKQETLVLSIIIPLGVVFSLIGWLIPLRYGKKIKKLAEAERDNGKWDVDCSQMNKQKGEKVEENKHEDR